MIIIQLLKDTKYPANYQIIIDSLLGNYAVLRDFFSALPLVNGRTRKRSAAGGMERSGSLCGRVAAPRETLHGRQCGSIGERCELANPAQVHQITSQAGVLFSAG